MIKNRYVVESNNTIYIYISSRLIDQTENDYIIILVVTFLIFRYYYYYYSVSAQMRWIFLLTYTQKGSKN
jgi:hypothetical protein